MAVRKRVRKILLFLLLVFTIVMLISACTKPSNESKPVVVIFNANGGIFPNGMKAVSFNIKYGESIVNVPEAPTRKGYVFIGWYLNDNFRDIDKLNIDLFRAVDSKTIFAKWESVETYPHLITIAQYSQATISVDKEKAVMGTDIRVTIDIHDVGYMLKPGSLKAGETVIDEDTLTFVMPAHPVKITAVFELTPFEIMVNEYNDGVITTSSQTAKRGEKVTVNAIPQLGYFVKRLFVVGTNEDILDNSVIMGANNMFIAADFQEINEKIKYKINIAKEENALIKIPVDYASEGEYVPIEIICDEGYMLSSINLNDNLIDREGFIMPNTESNISVKVTPILKTKEYNLTLAISPKIDGNIELKTNKNKYYAGERIVLDKSELKEHIIDSITLDGVLVSESDLFMPQKDATLTIVIYNILYSLTVSDASYPKPVVSHSEASEGELVKVEIPEDSDANMKKANVFYVHKFATNNDRVLVPLVNKVGFFRMPNYSIIISLDFTSESSSEKNTIRVDSGTGGTVQIKEGKTEFSLGELVFLEIVPETNFGLYELYYENNSTKEYLYSYAEIIPESKEKTRCFNRMSLNFTMINEAVRIKAVFRKYITITPFNNQNIVIYPNLTKAYPGDKINVSIEPRQNYDLAKISMFMQNGHIIEEKTFFAGDENIAFDIQTKSQHNEVSFDLVLETSKGGKITSTKRSYVTNEIVTLEVFPYKGYMLESLTIRKTADSIDNAVEISEAFSMPKHNAIVAATFVQANRGNVSADTVFSLADNYEAKVEGFYKDFSGLFLRKYESYDSIKSLFPAIGEYKIDNIIKYIDTVIFSETTLSLENSLWNEFYIIGLNKISHSNAVAQVLLKYVRIKNPNKSVVSKIIDNYIVISIDGLPEEDYYVFRNGLYKIDNNCYLFQRKEGSFGVYRWCSYSPFAIIPKEYKIEGQNKRIVDYIGINAFKKHRDVIEGIHLSNVKELAPYTLSNLSRITELDLSFVQNVGRGSLINLKNLSKYYVSNANNIYSVDNVTGVLYSKKKDVLVSYPIAKIDSSFNILDSVKIIGEYAFLGATNIKSLYLSGSKLIKLEDYSLARMVNLERIYGRGQTELANTANFSEGAASVLTIGNHVFSGTVLISTFLFNQVDEIGEKAFQWDNSSSLIIEFGNNDSIVNIYCDIIDTEIEIPTEKLSIFVAETLHESFSSHKIWEKYRNSIKVKI